MQQLLGNWSYPTAITFGAGSIDQLPEACKQLGISKPLLVTDSALAKLEFVTRLIDANEQAGLTTSLYSDVKSNPTGSNVEEGVAAYKRGGHDGVIALGGGSALDAGKAIALMIGQHRPMWDFEDIGDNWQRVNADGIAPLIAIPTTAGTGSEVGRASVIVDETRQLKVIIFHPEMLANRVIADPELTTGLPATLTAATGMDAFVHCLEAYCAKGYHPMADGIALQGMTLIRHWLPVAFEHPDDLEARSHMLAASMMGAVAFQKGLGAVHALAHPLGALYDKHHGLLNAILLPYVLVHNRPAIEDRIGHVARVLELDQASFDAFLQWILELRTTLQIPNDLESIGIDAGQSRRISEMAAADPSAAGNPLLLTAAEYATVFEAAVKGRPAGR
ncbi:MAG: iron-containing alcohol dehydrogenase [Thiotrichales bacterium]|nr:MAG: iron-containing alcohol dehydrogenase [Thiotrichales bacterium]